MPSVAPSKRLLQDIPEHEVTSFRSENNDEAYSSLRAAQRSPCPNFLRRRFAGKFASIFGDAKQHFLVRKSSLVDIETGSLESKTCTAEAVDPKERPMDRWRRVRNSILSWATGMSRPTATLDSSENAEEGNDLEGGSIKQYRLKTQRVCIVVTFDLMDHILYMCVADTISVYALSLCTMKAEDRSCLHRWTINPDYDNSKSTWFPGMTRYLNWSFRTTFAALVFQLMISFWIITTFFAGLFTLAAHFQPNCILVQGQKFEYQGTESFLDLFQLSWTTFSTVGYGLVYPNVAVPTRGGCYAINILAALEAFTGILYAATAAAIVFGKVSRFQRTADLMFSYAILVRYGSGVQPEANPGTSEVTCSDKEIPCPVLEFRMINGKHNVPGGEIVHSVVHCVASIKAENACDYIQLVDTSRHSKSKKKLGEIANAYFLNPVNEYLLRPISTNIINPISKNMVNPACHTLNDNVFPLVTSNQTLIGRSTSRHRMSSQGSLCDPDVDRHMFADVELMTRDALILQTSREQRAVIDEGSKLVPRRVFCTLELETPSHPFFKRHWIIRHTLNGNSPLLTLEARSLVAANNGFWPESLNSHQKLRQHVNFHEIVVCFTGKSNVSGLTVYNQKVYNYDDLIIGYTFANVLHHDARGKLRVDETLLNDVKEQIGGGGEPFNTMDEVLEDDMPKAATTTAKGKFGAEAEILETKLTKTNESITNGVMALKENTEDLFEKAKLKKGESFGLCKKCPPGVNSDEGSMVAEGGKSKAAKGEMGKKSD